MLRPVIVSTRYAPFIGGQEQTAKNLAQELIRRGGEVLVLTETLGQDLPQDEVIDNVAVARLSTPSQRSFLGQLRIGIQTFLFIKRRRSSIDWVLIRSYTVHAVAVGLLKRLRLLKCATIVSSDTGGVGDDLNALRQHPLRRLMVFLLLGNDYFNALTAGNIDNLKALGVPDGRITRVPNGIDVEAWYTAQLPHSISRLLFVGRLDEEKGPIELVQAMAQVVQACPRLELTIVGAGPLEHDVRRIVAELSLTEVVTVAGPLFGSDLDEAYRSHDCVVIASRSEGFCMVAYEAMTFRRVVVSTDVADLRDVFGEAITFAASNEPDALASAILAAVEKEEIVSDSEGVVLSYSTRKCTDALLHIVQSSHGS